MKNEGRKTAIFAGVAAVLVLLAWVTKPSPKAAEVFSDQGQEFYPNFKDPSKAAALEVVDFDPLTATYKPFRVQVVNGVWSIPSHENYPADGKDRLKNTATAVMDLRKERVASDNPKMHEEFGVVDPLDTSVQGTKGRGKRVKLYDASNTVLADFIFGKETGEGSGRRYVRMPDQKRTYVIKAQPDISVRFEDWVETDLLQFGSAAVKKVVIDKYSFDEEKMDFKNKATFFLSHDESAGPWSMSELQPTEEVNAETMTTMVSTLSGLRLAGVRAKPPVVAKAKNLDELGKMPRQQLGALARSMMQHGFFVVSLSGKIGIVSSEGEMQVSCDDGVVYTLRFGEVLVGSGDEVSSGKDEPKKKDEKKDDKKGGTENRYLFVSVRFDDSLLPSLPPEPKAYVADPAKKPEEQKAEEEKAKKEKEEWEHKKKDAEKKKEDGKKRAEKLTARFAEWYYVISADAFKKLRVERAQLVKAKEVPKDEKKPEDKKPEDKKPEDKKPEDKKPEDKKPDEKKPEEKKPEDKKPEDKKPEEKKPDEKKPEDKPKEKEEKKS